MATSVSAKHIQLKTFTQCNGGVCWLSDKQQNTVVLMQLHSRLTRILLMLLPWEIYATKIFLHKDLEQYTQLEWGFALGRT